MSNLKIVGVVLAVVALVGGGVGLALMSNSSQDMGSMKMESGAPSSDSAAGTSEAGSATSNTSDTPVGTNTVEIKDFAYAPASITIKKGTKVTWTNQDDVKHDVMTDTDGKGPSSELLAKDETYSFTFDEVGTFTYHCSPHPYMKGTVIVTE